jgi:hypothetical protein
MSSSWSETPLSSLRDYGLEEVFTIAGLYGVYSWLELMTLGD